MANIQVSDNNETQQQVQSFEFNTTGNLILDNEKMKSIMSMADVMSRGISTVPKHLQKNPADCMAIIIQAMQWGMNPFVVAQKTHIVNGALGYEAQLVNAVIQSSGIIVGTFKYEYSGDGESMACRVGAQIKETGKLLWSEWLAMNQVKIRNSPLWATNPKQQISYLQVKNWARKYYPSAILGVYTTDELQDTRQPKDITPRNITPEQQAEEQKVNDVKAYKLLIMNKCKETDINPTDFAGFMDFKSFQTVEEWQHVVDNFEQYKTDYIKAIVSDEE